MTQEWTVNDGDVQVWTEGPAKLLRIFKIDEMCQRDVLDGSAMEILAALAGGAIALFGVWLSNWGSQRARASEALRQAYLDWFKHADDAALEVLAVNGVMTSYVEALKVGDSHPDEMRDERAELNQKVGKLCVDLARVSRFVLLFEAREQFRNRIRKIQNDFYACGSLLGDEGDDDWQSKFRARADALWSDISSFADELQKSGHLLA